MFDLAPETGTMRIRSLHPGVSVDEVQAKTGFEVIVPARVALTEAPSARELALLRTQVDPDGLLGTLRITR